MAELKKHVGKLKNTGQKCVVIYRKIPNDENFALVVQSDQLMDRYHDNLMTVIESNEAQQTHDLYKVLARRSFGDGGQMLETLHRQNYLNKVPVSDVILYPLPNRPLPLEEANKHIADEAIEETPAVPQPENQSVKPQYSHIDGDPEVIAASKIEQARMMEQDAERLREEAYMLDPNLKPSAGRPGLSDEERDRRKEERNERRRERYQKKKAKKAKATKKSSKDSKKNSIEKAVEEKINRDINRTEENN